MTDDPLRNLLQRADRAAGDPPAAPSDLARHVRGIVARRRFMRTTIGVAAAVALGAAGVIIFSWPVSSSDAGIRMARDHATPIEPERISDGEESRRWIERLRSEAEMHRVIAKRIAEISAVRAKTKQLERQVRRPLADPLVAVRDEVDRAARTIFKKADRLLADEQLRKYAAPQFRRVVELFPDSPWAAVARARLIELKQGPPA